MKKISGILLGAVCWVNALNAYATEKFDILPDLPEPLSAAQASSVSTKTPDTIAQSIGPEPNIMSVIFSLIFVILLIYATGIIYARLNKVGTKTLKKHIGDSDDSRVTVISTTPLGSNKTLHIVELDGKRMLIGASANSIDLIKDLGSYPPCDEEAGEFSKIEIPNIRIPKIEIPKIEFPNIGFTKTTKKEDKNIEKENNETSEINNEKEYEEDFIISDIYEDNSDGIIDKLFTQKKKKNEENNENNIKQENNPTEEKNIHSIDPDEYALYKKYL